MVRNRNILACGVRNNTGKFMGLGFIESPGKNADALLGAYQKIINRFDHKALVSDTANII